MNVSLRPIELTAKSKDEFFNERSLKIKFTFKQKIYYNYVRPIVSKTLRKKIQKRVSDNVSFLDNFINTGYVKTILSSGQNWSILKSLYPGSFQSALIITHDVEEQDGFDYIPKLIEIDEKYGFKSSFNIVPYKYRIDKGIIDLIKENGSEVGIHGYNHDGKLYYSEKIFNERVPYINEAIKTYDAIGFRSPMVHRNIEWLQKLDIQYDASCFDYDPFQPFPGGVGSIWPFIAGKFVELPYTLPQDHTLFYVLKVKDISIWKNKVDWIVRNNGMALLLTHPDYLKDVQNMKLYEEFLDYLNSIQNSWRCLPKEMAVHWRAIQNFI